MSQYNPHTGQYESDDDVINEEILQIHRDGSVSIKGEESNGVLAGIVVLVTALLIPGGLLLLGGLIVAIPLAILSGIIDFLLPLIRLLEIPAFIAAVYSVYRMSNVVFGKKVMGKDTWFSFGGVALLMLFSSFIIFYPRYETDFTHWADRVYRVDQNMANTFGVIGIYILRTFLPSLIVPVISLVIVPIFGKFMLNKTNRKWLADSKSKR